MTLYSLQMPTVWIVVIAIIAILLSLIIGGVIGSMITKSMTKPCAKDCAWNALWKDHVAETREVILAKLKLPSGADATSLTNASVNRLLDNQVKIGDAFGKFVGDARAGQQLTTLLKTHITQAADVLDNLTSANRAQVTQAVTVLQQTAPEKAPTPPANPSPLLASIGRWYGNADDIVKFLADTTGHADDAGVAQALTAAFYTHLHDTLLEAAQLFSGNYAESIASVARLDGAIQQMASDLIALKKT